MNFFKRKEQKKQQRELQNRADQFMVEYRMIRARYSCDFEAFIKLIGNGEGGMLPALRIVDITKTIREEEAAERKKQEAIDKQELEGKSRIDKIKAPEPPKNAFGY